MTAHLVDLSHAIEHGMVTYPGLPGPEITDHLTREASHDVYAPGTEFTIGRISMVANTGTYVDSPFHRYADGVDLAGLRLDRLAEVEGLVVRVVGASSPAVDAGAFDGLDVGGKAVLVHTGWDRHWRTDAYGGGGHPYLTADACEVLVSGAAAIVGIDSVNIDDTSGGERVAHTALLGAGIPVVEHLRGLERLPLHGFTFSAVPPRVVGFGTFPVRAYARVGS
jgi:arylformamidase